MSDWVGDGGRPLEAVLRALRDNAEGRRRLPWALQTVLALVPVGIATLVGFIVRGVVDSPGAALVFVPAIVIAAMLFDWASGLVAVAASVLAFAFFFTEPYGSFAIADPSDVWAATLLLVTALVVSAVAAHGRRRVVETGRAMAQAQALQGLAHLVIGNRSRDEVVAAAADALHEIFEAPAAIFMPGPDGLRLAACAGGARITSAEESAASAALASRIRTRGGTYAHDRTEFDFWPLSTPSGSRCVLGVNFARTTLEQVPTPDPYVQIVEGYLATALARSAPGA